AELRSDLSPVSVPLIPEYKNLKKPLVLIRDRGLHSRIADAGIPCPSDLYPAGVDTEPREDLLRLGFNIHCRESQRAPELSSVFHNVGHLIGIPQQLCCKSHIPL